MYPEWKVTGLGEPALVRIGSISRGGGLETPSASTREALMAGRDGGALVEWPLMAYGGGRDGDLVLRSGRALAKAVGSLLISSSSWSTANEAAKGGFGWGKLPPAAIETRLGKRCCYTKGAGESAGDSQGQVVEAMRGFGQHGKRPRVLPSRSRISALPCQKRRVD